MVKTKPWTFIFFSVSVCINVALVSSLSWSNEDCSMYFAEDTEIGTRLINLTAIASNDGDMLIFSTDNILTDSLVNLSASWSTGTQEQTVGVLLMSDLDRDFTPQIKKLRFKVQDQNLISASLSCELIVRDVNDNPPIFQNLPYISSVMEDIKTGSVIFGNISVYDPDTNQGGIFTLSMVSDQINDDKFDFSWTAGFPGTSTAMIKLKSLLDYEERNFYTVMISAVDNGGLSSSAEITISVEDIQDSPPYFIQPIYRAAIVEHSPVNTSVIQIQAEDGDKGVPRDVGYRIIKGNKEYFAIDETTGWIIQTVSLDRDDAMMREINGVFDLTVQAFELNATVGENSTSHVTVTITIEDLNDNAPIFNTSTPYTAYVRDDTPPDSLIYFDGKGYMNVFDADQGSNAYFELSVERDGESFPALEPSPLEVYFEAFVLIRITNSSILKEYSGQHLSFTVIARETKTDEQLSSTAAVVLTIETTEEPTTTPPPPEEDQITAPDIVVFVVGFLVLLNIATSVTICVLMTKRKKNHSQGLARNGSKYYVTVTPKRPGLTVDATESNASNGISSTSVMQEIP
ncbi:hypothetical protein LOTGIDRAFT_229247 [Lottia gigantea]|uniref:Cadherin domain-containing protein n=1 Tax=Lottia gigantea TaxID=225164 RepID=V4A191_LOTGI|nr:hypothetical protein LOTGIDRAFT_229247 [Lottia gigantea]ESO87056.1 hypothetical protein LOTGIDRAFT_229247 [Lottia gigantea]